MEIRPARRDEIPYLMERLCESTHERVDLSHALCWVAVQDGKVVGMLPLRLMYQSEPLYLFPEFRATAPKHSLRRATYRLVKAMEDWLSGPVNQTGIRSYFFVVKDRLFQRLAERWGMTRIYTGCKVFGKDL